MTRGGRAGLRVEGQPTVRGSPHPPSPVPGASTLHSGRPSPFRSPRLTSQAEAGSMPLLARPAAPSAKKEAVGAPPRLENTIGGRPFADPLMIGFDCPGGQAACSGRPAKYTETTTHRPR